MHRPASLRSRAALVAALATLALARPTAADTLLCGTAGDELVAARAGLEREWVVQIPFDSAGWQLEHVTIGDDLVVACSGDGGVHAVQAGTSAGGPRAGSVLWSQRLGRPSGPVQPAGIGPQIVTVARDIDLYGLDSRDGSQRWHRPLARPPSGGAEPAGDWVFVPLSAGGMMRFPVNPFAQPKAANAKGAGRPEGQRQARPVATTAAKTASDPLRPLSLDAGGRVESTPVAYQGGVLWCTTAGRLVAVFPVDDDWRRIEFDLGSACSGAPVVGGASIVVATEAGDLARIVAARGDETRDFDAAWHVVLDSPPEGGPLVSGETVVVSLGDEGIAAFAVATGDRLWTSCTAGRLVATTGNRVWCVDRVGRLASLDIATGMPAEWMCLGSFSLPLVNTVSEKLLLASPDGLIVCLAPRRTTSALPAPPPGGERQSPAVDEAPAAEEADAERTET